MKKAILMAAVAAFVATPAMAKDAEQMEKKIDSKFMEMDKDGNGMISKSEHTAAMDMMFDEADTNDDGSVSKEEMKAHKMKEKEEMKDKS